MRIDVGSGGLGGGKTTTIYILGQRSPASSEVFRVKYCIAAGHCKSSKSLVEGEHTNNSSSRSFSILLYTVCMSSVNVCYVVLT